MIQVQLTDIITLIYLARCLLSVSAKEISMSKATLIGGHQGTGRAVRVYALSVPKVFRGLGMRASKGHCLGGTGQWQ